MRPCLRVRPRAPAESERDRLSEMDPRDCSDDARDDGLPSRPSGALGGREPPDEAGREPAAPPNVLTVGSGPRPRPI
eukprot:5178434-Prymnesium_polylepis.1